VASATRKDVVVPAPHPPEFRQRAVELARLGEQPISVLAKQLSISESCLRNWMAQADADDGGNNSRLTTAEKQELTQLRRDQRRLEMENEILKRAALKSTRQRNTFSIVEVCGGEVGSAGDVGCVPGAVVGVVARWEGVQRDLPPDRVSAWFDLHGDQADRRVRPRHADATGAVSVGG